MKKNVYGSKTMCKKHEVFHLVDEDCPYCVPDNPTVSDDEIQEKLKYQKQMWHLMWA